MVLTVPSAYRLMQVHSALARRIEEEGGVGIE